MRSRWLVSLALAATSPALVLSACEAGTDTNGNPKITTCTPEPAEEAPAKSTGPTGTFDKINHFVVIYLENHSFDNLYGEFPGAEGIKQAAAAPPQQDQSGTAYAALPQPVDPSKSSPDPRFPANLANAPFPIEKYIAQTDKTPDLVHRWYQEPLQIHGGKMDRFVAYSDAKGLVMGYWHTVQLPLYTEAANYTLCDHFFHAAFGGSFLNHQWLVAAASPTFPNAPTSTIAQLDGKGGLVSDGFVTAKGCYVVNTAFTKNAPHPPDVPAANLMPQQNSPTIGDRLSDKSITWAWYAGGWNNAIAGDVDASAKAQFQYHHQPFAYYAKYADGTPGRADHLKDETEFLDLAKAGNLPQVSFVKPVGVDNEHPGYANMAQGETHVLSLINAVRSGPNWKDTAIIITYDENGGQYDHVAPPGTDKWGPGSRVPAIVISPFAKKGFIDTTVYDTTSILATIEHRWGLDPLTSRDAKATDMANAFDFTASP
jgi:phospholipase C